MDYYNGLTQELQASYPEMKIIKISKDDIVFNEKVKMNCFYCEKNGTNWTCPPKIPEINYRLMVSEYVNIAVVVNEMCFSTEADYELTRHKSAFDLHRALLTLESYLWNCNHSLAVSFIGGSCRLCKGGCGKDKCNNKKHSRIPVEALGINVVDTLENVGITITFPPCKKIVRAGMIMW